MQPQVTVIIPFYNAANTLRRAITSALAQTYSPAQVICVDDGSTDNAKQVVHSIVDNRIVYIHLARNCGKATALNAALEVATGDYLLELDADDWLPKSAVRTLVRQMNHARSCVAGCYGNRQLWREHHGRLYQTGMWRGPQFHDRYAFLLRTLACPPGPRFLNRQAVMSVGGWTTTDPTYGRLYEDYWVWLKLLGIAELTYCPRTVYHVMRQTSSTTQQTWPVWPMLRNLAISEALCDWEAPWRPVFHGRSGLRLLPKQHYHPSIRVAVEVRTGEGCPPIKLQQTLQTLQVQTVPPICVVDHQGSVLYGNPVLPSNYHYFLRIDAGVWLVPDAIYRMVAKAKSRSLPVAGEIVQLGSGQTRPLAYTGLLHETSKCVLYRSGQSLAATAITGPVVAGVTEVAACR